ncbi:unnamed protein product, partial [Amoebophrya sp. A25]
VQDHHLESDFRIACLSARLGYYTGEEEVETKAVGCTMKTQEEQKPASMSLVSQAENNKKSGSSQKKATTAPKIPRARDRTEATVCIDVEKLQKGGALTPD